MKPFEGYRLLREDRQVRLPEKLETWAEAYVSLREAMGFKTVELVKNLRSLICFMLGHGIESFSGLQRRSAVSWLYSNTPQEITVMVRLACVRGFFRYLLGLGEVEENVWDTFANPGVKRFVPCVLTPAELRALLDRVRSRIIPEKPLGSRVHSAYYTMFHTIYACGLRTCEACNLDIGDMILERSLFVVKNTKFGKSRYVPFNSRTREIVLGYLDRFRPVEDGLVPTAPLFLSNWRRRFRVKNVSGHFSLVCAEAGIYKPKVIKGNVVYGGTTTHALRHSFAVHRLMKWYEEPSLPT